MRVLALITDGFGAPGGIARYNQALLNALAALERVEQVLVIPRFGEAGAGQPPPGLRQLPPSPGKVAYCRRVLGVIASRPRFDLLFCGHINMAALAAGLARWLRCPWWLQIHGIDAWDPPGRLLRSAVARADLVTAVSRHTRARFLAWAELAPDKVQVLPNVLDPRFTPGPKPVHLLRRYGLEGRRVLLTVGRISRHDRAKGHDRVIRALPRLRARFPDLAYVIAGDGDGRPDLEALAQAHGVADIVRFVGAVPEAELVDHYRMADLFVMPSTKEGFGIVFLEAMACGLPTIGGDVDGSVDPLSCSPLGMAVPPEQVTEAIAALLEAPLRPASAPALAERFGIARFAAQLAALTSSSALAGR
jgi:phosphatidyl-myo-inositol dimannoside synthase